MDLDVILFIKTMFQLMNRENGTEFTVIIVRLSWQVKGEIKVD